MTTDRGHDRGRPARPLLVGRRAELEVLDGALGLARQGQPQLVLLEGDAGIGKTALVDRFVGTARADVVVLRARADVVVLRARADELESHLAFGVATQLLASIVPPGARARAHSVPFPHDLDPLAAGAQLLATVGELQGAAATVVAVIDDAHLADSSSTAALVFAARRLLADRVLLLLTARPGVLDAGWSRLLATGPGRRLVLAGLTPEGVRELAAQLDVALNEREAAWLHGQTDGHPLYVLTLLESDPSLARADAREASALPPPPALAALVVARLERCSPGARDLVSAAAVLGRLSPLTAAASVGEVDAPPAALDEAVAAGLLLDPVPPGRELRFPHALVRAAVYRHLGASGQVRLHGRAAAYTTGTTHLHHRLAAATGADERLAAQLEAVAAEERAAGALVAAGEHLRQAADVSPRGASADRRMLEAVETWLVAGEASRALALEHRVRAMDRGPHRDHVLGYLALVGGRLPDAESAFRRSWAELERAGSAEAAGAPADLAGRIAVGMASLAVVDLNVDEMLDWGEAARRFAVGDARTVSFGLFCWALSMGTLGRGVEALAQLDAPDVPGTADVLAARGLLELWTDDAGAARGHLALAFARSRAGEPMRVSQALGFLAEAEYRLGRFDEAAVHAELAVEGATEAGRVWDLPLLHSLAAYPSAARGDFEVAAAHVQQAADGVARAPIAAFRSYASAARAALALGSGDVAALLEAGPELEVTHQLADPGTVTLGPVLAEALVESGRLDEAERALVRYEQRARAVGRRSSLVGAARVRGSLHAALGDHAAAEAAFRSGAEVAGGLALPLELARLEDARGRALALAGRMDLASAALQAACRAFERIGARPYAAAARAHLAALAPAAAGRPPVVLSAAEAMVARLVSAGLSNREIAEQLVISVKAVEFHLTNIYRRLGVSSRVKLAQLVAPPAAEDPTAR